MLPKVKAFQIWNEPNLTKYLSPQWTGARAASPRVYRAMLNGIYRGVKSAGANALVVSAGTAPFGQTRDPAGSACSRRASGASCSACP